MKIFRKKLTRGTILLFLSFLVVSICCITITSAIRINRENRLSSRNFYSDSARRFTVEGYEGTGFWEGYFAQNQKKDFVLYNSIWDESMDIRAVYVNGKIPAVPTLRSGRFFHPEDVSAQSKTAVVGKNFEKDLVEENGKRYFYYGDIPYEVIGVMGTEDDSRINALVFLDFYSGIALNTVNGRYILDAPKKTTVNSLLPDMERAMTWEGGSMSVSAEDVAMGVDRIFAEQEISQALYGMILFCFLLSAMIVAVLWVSYRRNSIAVKMMLGHANGHIVLDLMKEFFKSALWAYLISLLCVVLIQMQNRILTLQAQDLVLSLFITVLFGLLSIFYPLIKTLKQNASQIMR